MWLKLPRWSGRGAVLPGTGLQVGALVLAGAPTLFFFSPLSLSDSERDATTAGGHSPPNKNNRHDRTAPSQRWTSGHKRLKPVMALHPVRAPTRPARRWRWGEFWESVSLFWWPRPPSQSERRGALPRVRSAGLLQCRTPASNHLITAKPTRSQTLWEPCPGFTRQCFRAFHKARCCHAGER